MHRDNHLNKKPGSDQSKSTVLTIEAIMIGVKGKMIKIEKPEKNKTMSL